MLIFFLLIILFIVIIYRLNTDLNYEKDTKNVLEQKIKDIILNSNSMQNQIEYLENELHLQKSNFLIQSESEKQILINNYEIKFQQLLNEKDILIKKIENN